MVCSTSRPMDAKAIEPAPITIRSLLRNAYPDLLFLLALDWVAHFWHFYRFGLYEDDWYFNTGPYTWSSEVWFDLMWRQVAEYVFGRPVEILLLYINGYIGYAFDSVGVLYVIAYLLSAAATVMVYLVLRQCFPRRFALLAAVFFVLSPLTTVRQFLNTSYKMAPSYVLAMGGLLAFLRRRYVLAYVLGAMMLVTYEWLFMVFVGAPLLVRETPLISRRTVRHVVICIGILGLAFAIRSMIGEARVTTELPGPIDLVIGAVRATFVHVLNVPLLYLNGSFLALAEGTAKAFLFGLVMVVWYFWVLLRRREPGTAGDSADNLDVKRAVLVGAAFALLGLGLAFIVAPGTTLADLQSTGRGTRIFGPAEFGVAIAAAGICTALWRLVSRSPLRYAVALLGVVLFTVLTMYGFVVQSDYIRAWQEHRNIAAQIIEQTPDISPDASVIVELKHQPPRLFQSDGRYLSIGEEKTMFHRVLYFLFAVDQPTPNLYLLYSDNWRNQLSPGDDGVFYWDEKPIAGFFTYQDEGLRPGQVFRFRQTESGELVRDDTPIEIGGVVLNPPPAANVSSAWSVLKPSGLFRYVFPEGLSDSSAPESIE
jgi:hypothetical protein